MLQILSDAWHLTCTIVEVPILIVGVITILSKCKAFES